MFRVFAFLMAILLLFNAMRVSFAQQSAVQAEAEADASADMSNSSKVDWFLLGGLGSTVGCFLGCAGGCFLGGLGRGYTSDSFNATQTDFAAAGAVLLGVCAVPTAVFAYPYTVTPPPERLLGKSPEYIQTYTRAYQSRTVSLRKIFVTAGSVASNLGVMTTVLILMFRFGFSD